MRMNLQREWTKFRERACSAMIGPQALALLPALVLASYWIGGETTLLIVALAVPGVFLLLGGLSIDNRRMFLPRDSFTGLLQRDGFEDLVENTFMRTVDGNRNSAVFHIELDDFTQLVERHGEAAGDAVIQRTGDRIVSTLRDVDNVARLGDCRFAVCLGATRNIDLEVCIQLAGRIQNIIEEPVSVDGVSVYMTAAIGFCLRGRAPGDTSADWTSAASTALRAAQKRGPSAIRAYTEEMRRISETRAELRDEVTYGLEAGQLTP